MEWAEPFHKWLGILCILFPWEDVSAFALYLGVHYGR